MIFYINLVAVAIYVVVFVAAAVVVDDVVIVLLFVVFVFLREDLLFDTVIFHTGVIFDVFVDNIGMQIKNSVVVNYVVVEVGGIVDVVVNNTFILVTLERLCRNVGQRRRH